MAKKYFNRLGISVLESAGIMILVTSAILALLYFLKNPSGFPGFQSGDRNYRELIKQDRARAELVIIGRITRKSAQIQENMNAYGVPEGIAYGYVDFAVESVERGYYPHDKISVYFGWASSLTPPDNFPLGTKKDYKVGDKARVFISHGTPDIGPDEPCYFTALAYLSLEPLGSSKDRDQ